MTLRRFASTPFIQRESPPTHVSNLGSGVEALFGMKSPNRQCTPALGHAATVSMRDDAGVHEDNENRRSNYQHDDCVDGHGSDLAYQGAVLLCRWGGSTRISQAPARRGR